jgi:hypothetical protein
MEKGEGKKKKKQKQNALGGRSRAITFLSMRTM